MTYLRHCGITLQGSVRAWLPALSPAAVHDLGVLKVSRSERSTTKILNADTAVSGIAVHRDTSGSFGDPGTAGRARDAAIVAHPNRLARTNSDGELSWAS